jgi:hypothetical protein
MSTCFYITDIPNRTTIDKEMNANNPPSVVNWCAGGRAQKPPINFGAIPEEIKALVAKVEKGRPVSEGLPKKLGEYVAELERKVKGPEAKGHYHE